MAKKSSTTSDPTTFEELLEEVTAKGREVKTARENVVQAADNLTNAVGGDTLPWAPDLAAAVARWELVRDEFDSLNRLLAKMVSSERGLKDQGYLWLREIHTATYGPSK
jgi:hypothetical protein